MPVNKQKGYRMNNILKIIIMDGIVQDVIANEATEKLIKENQISIDIIDYDRDRDNSDEFEKEFAPELNSVDYSITHPGN